MTLDASKPLLAEYDAEAGAPEHSGEKNGSFRVPPLPDNGDGAAFQVPVNAPSPPTLPLPTHMRREEHALSWRDKIICWG